MKKFILILILSAFAIPVHAEFDYAYEAITALQTCMKSNTKCEEAKRYVNDGINYYSNKKNDSFENLKNYCSLLYLRVGATSWGNMEQWQRDRFNYERSCSF